MEKEIVRDEGMKNGKKGDMSRKKKKREMENNTNTHEDPSHNQRDGDNKMAEIRRYRHHRPGRSPRRRLTAGDEATNGRDEIMARASER